MEVGMVGRLASYFVLYMALISVIYIQHIESNTYNELRKMLFLDYNPEDMPSMPVDVNVSLNLLSLNDLDIKYQRFSIAAYFYFTWYDSRLEWYSNPNLTYYHSVRSVFSREANIWVPSIIIENSVNDMDVIRRPNTPIRVGGEGQVTWLPAGLFTTHCDSDITYWPLDTQTCHVIISTWAVTGEEVNLQFSDDVMMATSYETNGEWELVAVSNQEKSLTRENAPFRRLMFTFTYRRRHLFHTLNTILPVILFGFLTIVVFKLNPESGERVGLSLTILLAYSVYLSLISGSIPQTSLSASLLSTYLATILLLQTLSVFMTVIHLDVFFTSDEKPIPKWVQKVMGILTKLMTCNGTCSKKVTKIGPNANQDQDGIIVVKAADDIDKIDKKEMEGTFDGSDEEIRPSCQYTWKEIARMMDKVAMYLYIIFLVLLTLVIAVIVISQYANTDIEGTMFNENELRHV